MNVGAVMAEVGTRLETIDGLQVLAFPGGTPTPPTAIVDMPDTYTYDATFGRGTDQFTLPVHVICGRVWDATTRDRLAGFADGSGASSVKAVLEADGYTTCDEATVTDCEFATIVFGGVDYLGAMFTVRVTGPGAT